MMRPIGVVRRVDCLGRVVIPSELRQTMDIDGDDSLEIYVDRDMIVIKKYEPVCFFCGSSTGVTKVKGKNICESCLREFKELLSD